ncbi:MAG: glycosyltransferase [Burkholderiales bacterium]|nr:glycosyltransferase [Burkholderiales bacterium]
MRIAHLLFTDRFAGSERYAIELANAQADRHEVTPILRASAAETRPDALAHRVDARVRTVLVDGWRARWQARRLLRRLKPDVAHAHLSQACKTLRGLDAGCLRVATLHIHYKPQQHKCLDALVAIAPWQLADVDARLREHTVQIDNWTAPIRAAPDARARLRRAHGIADDAWVFGALGRVEHSKGLDRLIEAFQQARPPNARLVIVGQGPELDALRRRAGPELLLPGFSAEPQDWMMAFDCFVSAARSEPFGLVFLEAMQAGLPVLATRTQGALHLAPRMEPTLVPQDDLPALVTALRELAERRPERRSYPMQHYRLDAKLAEFDTFYARELGQLRR